MSRPHRIEGPEPLGAEVVAILGPVAASQPRAPTNWERVRASLSNVTVRERRERTVGEINRDRRAASELRRVARELPALEPAEVLARLRAVAEDFEGGAANG